MKFTDIGDLIGILTDLALRAGAVLDGLAILFFLWGLADFILHAADSDARKKGRERMIWGIISLFVLVSFMALITMVQNTFFVSR